MKANTQNKSTKRKYDLPETKEDKKELQPDEGTLDLPEVKDIPGQEHIHVPRMKEFADTTISSSDEEGAGILDDEEDNLTDTETNVTPEEKTALREAASKTPYAKDEQAIDQAKLDNRDQDGELLNESVDLSGSDLDIPGSEADDEDEEIGEEDEENNSYSLDGEDEDDSISKQ